MEARRRNHPIALIPALAAALLLAASSCKDRKAEPPTAQAIPSEQAPDFDEVAPPDRDDPSEQFEYGITGTELYPYAGKMDVTNRYLSAVVVTTTANQGASDCSGVLVSPRLVLTAASCLCQPRKTSPSPGETESFLIDGSNCAGRAAVTTMHYGEVLDTEYPEGATQKLPHRYDGEFRPHPEFTLTVNARGAARTGHADLGVIVLDEPVKDVRPEALLQQGEVQAGEFLMMSGYGSDGTPHEQGGLYGVRYFRKNKVTRVLPPEDGRILYEQQAPYLYDGFAGGPCFREQGARRWLVGIASRGSDEELAFTSVSSFRHWLRSEFHRAAKAPLASQP
jgi:hypothetical protein